MPSPTKKILSVVGARPQFIKEFALAKALQSKPEIHEVVVHTGQHYDDNMSGIFFKELGMNAPDYHFAIERSSVGAMTGQMLTQIEGVIAKEKPDAVLVFGDTNSTLAGALAAAQRQVPLMHVEAGMRSFNRRMPEEMNRVVTDHLADVLFCATETSVQNLTNEGITEGVHLVGDIACDAARYGAESAKRVSQILDALELAPRSYAVATLHRAENTADRELLLELLDYLATVARTRPVIFPVHPRTRAAVETLGLSLERPGLRLIDPVGYIDMCELVRNAALVLTDSGGLQRDAFVYQVPCITLRQETEWVETVACGWNRLWKTEDYQPRRHLPAAFDGHAGTRIADVIGHMLQLHRD